MDPIPDHLSLWELAHRWHGALPSSLDDSSVTRAIRDTLLALVQAVLHERFPVYQLGLGWVIEGEKKHSPRFSRYDLSPERVAEDFEQMFASGIFDRKVLQAYSVKLDDVFRWCEHEGYGPPDLGVPTMATTEPKREAVEIKVRPEAEDKAKCQEIAAKKWAGNPQIRIAEMARDQDIRVEGNGGLYKPPTLLAWLREIAPDTVKGKPGRPRRENTPPK